MGPRHLRRQPRWEEIRYYVSHQNNTLVCYAIFEQSGVARGEVSKLSGVPLQQLSDRFPVVAL